MHKPNEKQVTEISLKTLMDGSLNHSKGNIEEV